jgi:hypothetical protein
VTSFTRKIPQWILSRSNLRGQSSECGCVRERLTYRLKCNPCCAASDKDFQRQRSNRMRRSGIWSSILAESAFTLQFLFVVDTDLRRSLIYSARETARNRFWTSTISNPDFHYARPGIADRSVALPLPRTAMLALSVII